MNQSVELLCDVARSARMGLDAVNLLKGKTGDAEMLKELNRQAEQYTSIEQSANARISELGDKPERISALTKTGLWTGVQMNTAFDRSNAHIADMLIQGATMGVIDVTRSRNRLGDADPQSAQLAGTLISNEQDSIERMKSFLN